MNKCKTVMIQGTGSSVGKSVIVTGLCRLLSRKGFKVAPFKAQNMALNSYITLDGKEMGRAQVVQAEAAMIQPDADMNPVLIKPNSDTGAQIIIQGSVIGNMSAVKYHSFKKEAKKFVQESFNRLCEKFEIIIIEGAGSPAEINLIENDIVNMGMAEMADAPVILTGDIDKGGVFASLVGTIELLPQEHRKRVKAFLINKFRGDKSLLKSGLDIIEKKTGIPFIGVIPYFKDVYIQEEDGVAVDGYVKKELTQNDISIAILHLPHISNFTDFDALEKEPDVSLKYLSIGESLAGFDILIIPGSKNTIDDLIKIKEAGFHTEINDFLNKGGFVVGICGGFQMLGEKILDPYHVESFRDSVPGLNLLKFRTVMEKLKTTRQVEVTVNHEIKTLFVDEILKGYEIHMGQNEYFERTFLFKNLKDETEDGLISANNKIFGTYIHGIFDNDKFRRKFLNLVRQSKGLTEMPENLSVKYHGYKEKGFNKLADYLEENINLDMLFRILNA